jgi:hypothetical protein
VQLSYLAQGFDWSANYVARVAEDGKTLDLFAWMTVANGGSQGFAGANTQAVAGGLHREPNRPLPAGPRPDLQLQCWPMDITSTHDRWSIARPLPLPPAEMVGEYSDIVVTANRFRTMSMSAPTAVAVVMVTTQEELGDLKLYRIPEPVTVAARSRKQVAMINRHKVRFERIYTADFEEFDYGRGNKPESQTAALILRTENKKANGLGLPLPAGGVAVFEQGPGVSLLVGESSLQDRAIGDEIEFGAGESSDVRYVIAARPPSERRRPYSVRVTNARATPEQFELAIPYKIVSAKGELVDRKGRKVWRVTVPANGEATLEFALELEVPRERD